jgi:hypothetical protein
MHIAVQLEPAAGTTSKVEYTWDADTDILSAQLSPRTSGDGLSGSVEVEGSDGSWVILDVAAGHINGVEIAVWPDVRKLPVLAPPANVQDAQVLVPSRRSQPQVAAVEIDTRVIAETDTAERTFHFRLGKLRESRTVRIARDLLVDVDERSTISGLWLLNVPPCPNAA